MQFASAKCPSNSKAPAVDCHGRMVLKKIKNRAPHSPRGGIWLLEERTMQSDAKHNLGRLQQDGVNNELEGLIHS